MSCWFGSAAVCGAGAVCALPSPDSTEAKAAAKQLQPDIKVFIGTSVSIELKTEGGVERSQGKAKRVVDLRSK